MDDGWVYATYPMQESKSRRGRTFTDGAMRWSKLLPWGYVVVLALSAVAISGCQSRTGDPSTGATVDSPRPAAVSASTAEASTAATSGVEARGDVTVVRAVDAVRERFNRHADLPRVITILSPT